MNIEHPTSNIELLNVLLTVRGEPDTRNPTPLGKKAGDQEVGVTRKESFYSIQ